MGGDIEKYSGKDQDEALSGLIEYADGTFSNEHMVVALPYFFAGMRHSEIATALSDVLNTTVSTNTVSSWLNDDDYKRVVATGRKLMTEWNLRRLQQLSVMAMNYIAEELKEPAMTMAERRHKSGLAQFVIKQQSRADEKKTQKSVDVPSMLVGAQSMALVAQQIAHVLSGNDVTKERDSITGEYTVIERDDMELVDELSAPVPKFGVFNVDWDAGRIQCHVCNGFYGTLNNHIKGHDLTIEEYRETYGISEDIPFTFNRLSNDCDIDRIAWRGRRMVVVDGEKNLRPYDRADEPEDDTADSGSVEEVSSGVGDELSDIAKERKVGLH